mmetsp:Transcript_35910/g.66399  ORF Transcript_35910/g.66399 Transcript_35910/m.66399 type:complete len:178 (-) Transcript_35910:199-732(-)
MHTPLSKRAKTPSVTPGARRERKRRGTLQKQLEEVKEILDNHCRAFLEAEDGISNSGGKNEKPFAEEGTGSSKKKASFYTRSGNFTFSAETHVLQTAAKAIQSLKENISINQQRYDVLKKLRAVQEKIARVEHEKNQLSRLLRGPPMELCNKNESDRPSLGMMTHRVLPKRHLLPNK